MDVPAQDDLRQRVGAAAGPRGRRGSPGHRHTAVRPRQPAKPRTGRGKCDATTTRSAWPPQPANWPTYCGGAGPRSTATPARAIPSKLERLLVEQPNPMLASAARRTRRRDGCRGFRSPSPAERRPPPPDGRTCASRSLGFSNWTMSPSRRIRSTSASENHARAASVRRSRCSGSKTLIQREPAGSSSQWRSLRTPMRMAQRSTRLAADEDHRRSRPYP